MSCLISFLFNYKVSAKALGPKSSYEKLLYEKWREENWENMSQLRMCRGHFGIMSKVGKNIECLHLKIFNLDHSIFTFVPERLIFFKG